MSSICGESRPPKVGMVSLGCAKNLVDAEIMLGDAVAAGFEITADHSDADVIVVNTCGFIESAKRESIDAILGARRKPDQKLVVSGCLAQRYREELARELPEVDAFMGLDQVAVAGRVFRDVFPGTSAVPSLAISPRSKYIPDYDTPRFRLTPAHTAYVKIAEGCNHPCSFCVIPQMRGRHRSRTINSVVAEVRNLVAEGVREINLISQDTTYFGMDLWKEKAGPRQRVDSLRGPTLVPLLDELATIEGEFWIRLLYTHPAHWSEELIAAIARNPKVARYVDMPLQHIHDKMLEAMRRETSRAHIEELISRLRSGIPGAGHSHDAHRWISGRARGTVFLAAGFYRTDAIRAPGSLRLFAGGGFSRGQDAGPGSGENQEPPAPGGDETPAAHRLGARGSAGGQDAESAGRSAAGRAERARCPGCRLPGDTQPRAAGR